VFENRVLRKIFGSKRDEVTGEWRKLHKEENNDQTFWQWHVTWINLVQYRDFQKDHSNGQSDAVSP
jgi:hypothetical protein